MGSRPLFFVIFVEAETLQKSSLCFLWRRHACKLFKSRELYVTSRARCAAFAPRTHGLENMPGCSATERSIEEIDGRRAEITEISGNILGFFFEKNFADPGRMFLMILKKIGVIYFQSRRRVGVK